MKDNYYVIRMGLCIICCLCIASAERSNEKAEVNNSSVLGPQTRATLELRGEWKATLFSRPFVSTFLVEGKEVRLTDTLYYVEVVTSDSETPRRVWQRIFATMLSSPQAIHKSFVFGPGDDHRVCLAFIQGFTVYFFILDSRDNVSPLHESDTIVDTSKSPSATIIDHDPNAIVLPQVLGKEFRQVLAEKEMETSIDAISCHANYAVIHLSIGQQKLILKCSLGAEKPSCSIYQLTEFAK